MFLYFLVSFKKQLKPFSPFLVVSHSMSQHAIVWGIVIFLCVIKASGFSFFSSSNLVPIESLLWTLSVMDTNNNSTGIKLCYL